jgi:hypothetical protein
VAAGLDADEKGTSEANKARSDKAKEQHTKSNPRRGEKVWWAH